MEKQPVNDELMEQVSGGSRIFNKKTQILTYDRVDGGMEQYKILDFEKAWELSHALEGRMPEDQIIQKLLSRGYIE